jgi:hypothetical protein
VSGLVDTDEFGRRLGVADGRARLDRELRSFVAGLGDERLPAFSPPVSVVRPPRPRRPDEVAVRTQACLETGSVKGGPWTAELTTRLRAELALPDDSALLLTGSGSAALRLAVQAIAGPVRPDDVAVLPSFTFAATGEMLAQLGFTLRFCDVRPDTWTMDPDSLAAALADGDAAVVVAVDALGAPADYTALTKVCADAGVPLVADSAAALGAGGRARPARRRHQALLHTAAALARLGSVRGAGRGAAGLRRARPRGARPADVLGTVTSASRTRHDGSSRRADRRPALTAAQRRAALRVAAQVGLRPMTRSCLPRSARAGSAASRRSMASWAG